MDPARLHPLTLRLDPPEAEAAFREDYVRRSVLLARLSLATGVSQIALFGLLDRAMIPAAIQEVVLIRGVVCAGVLAVIAYTFAPSFRRLMQAAMAVPPLLAGFGIIALSVIGQASNGLYDYYGGVMIVLVYAHALLRLRFVVASVVGGVLIGVNLAALAATGMPGLLLVNATFYLLSTNLTGMVASYALERYARRVWMDTQRQERTNVELTDTLAELRAAQARLVQQEKMASLGRLTAGVAHEIKNPLNFVNNFAEVAEELAGEIAAAVARLEEKPDEPDEAALAEVKGLMADLRLNVAKIRDHGARADAIVRAMQDHAGTRHRTRQPAALNALVEEQAALTREAFCARHHGFSPTLDLHLDPAVGTAAVIPQEIARVVTNLVNNALSAVHERSRTAVGGDGAPWLPVVTVRTRAAEGTVLLEVEDNGTGIPAAIRERVFEPFFTTKPAGTGTGLGLSLAYDVVTNGHGGTLSFETEEGQGTRFTVTLPLSTEPARAPGEALS